jgi:NAD(P)-dependent dehydrogenase (short-subunit alcohol dehydrogenase family)
MRLKDKVAIITGGNQGIGRAVVELFVKEGAKVVVGDLGEPKEKFGPNIEGMRLDVTKEDEWTKLVEATVAKYGRIDVLVNNAGILTYEPIHECSLESWSRTIAVNQTGPFLGHEVRRPNDAKAEKGIYRQHLFDLGHNRRARRCCLPCFEGSRAHHDQERRADLC